MNYDMPQGHFKCSLFQALLRKVCVWGMIRPYADRDMHGAGYSATGLREGRGPQLSPHTTAIGLQAEAEMRTVGLFFLHFAPRSETQLESPQFVNGQ